MRQGKGATQSCPHDTGCFFSIFLESSSRGIPNVGLKGWGTASILPTPWPPSTLQARASYSCTYGVKFGAFQGT